MNLKPAVALLLALALSPERLPAQGFHRESVPPELTLPAGTLITVRSNQPVSSKRNTPGDAFTTTLEQPVVTQGWVVAQRGQIALARVVDVRQAGRVRGLSELAVELTELVTVDGQQLSLQTQLLYGSAESSKGRDAQVVGTTTGLGATVGAAADGGRGAGIGAAIGALAGIAGVLSTRGRPTEILSETVLTFRLESPVTILTQQAPHAFAPVTHRDYQTRGTLRLPSHTARRYSRPGPRIGIGVSFGHPHYYRVRTYPLHYRHHHHRHGHWPSRTRYIRTRGHHRHGNRAGVYVVFRGSSYRH